MPRRFTARPVLQGFAYRLAHHPSFYVSVLAHLICATATVGFILAFIQQASYTGNTRRFNIVIIAALLGAVLFTSCFLILARIIAVRTSFNTIPKPYIPTKHIDVPRKVAEHISREYTRTGVIAYISQPTAGKQEGWGRPGTQFASIHFRKSIRETFHVILKTLDDQSPAGIARLTYPPYSIRQITSHPNWPASAQPLLEMYDAILSKAKYARSEPDAEEYERCIKIVALIMGLIKTAHHAPVEDPTTPQPTTQSTQPPTEPQQPPQAHLASPHTIHRPLPHLAPAPRRSRTGSRVDEPRSRSTRTRRGSLMALFDQDPSVHPGHLDDAQDQGKKDRESSSDPPSADARAHDPLQEDPQTTDLHAPRHNSLPHNPPPPHPHHHRLSLRRSIRPSLTVPRPRRRGTTRVRGSDGDESEDGLGRGTAGFLHDVWGSGRRADRELGG